MVEDCCCEYETVDSINEEVLHPILQELVKLPFFRYFKVRICGFCFSNVFVSEFSTLVEMFVAMFQWEARLVTIWIQSLFIAELGEWVCHPLSDCYVVACVWFIIFLPYNGEYFKP